MEHGPGREMFDIDIVTGTDYQQPSVNSGATCANLR